MLRPIQALGADPRLATRLDSILDGYGANGPVGFVNPATGMGTNRDKTTYTTFGTYVALDPQTLAGLYHGHDMSARVVDVIPDEELRLPFEVETERSTSRLRRAAEFRGDSLDEISSVEGDPRANEAEQYLKREFKRLDVRQHLLTGRKWGRCFGGAATIIGAQDGRSAAAPLVAPSRVDWLRTLDRRYLWPSTWYTSGAKNGTPETYYLNDCHPGGSDSFVIHESRLILWPGILTAQREKDLNWSWDYSILDRCWSVLKMFETLYKGVELLVTEGPQAVYKVRGLLEQLAADGGEEALQTRLAIADTMRSIFRCTVIDADGGEDFQRQQVTYSGTPEILTQMQLRLSAATQIPMLVLFGQAPGGLGVTGENDLRWFFDRTASSQRNLLAPKIEQLADLLLGIGGYLEFVGTCEVEFEPLWTPSAKEQAEERFITSQTDKNYIESLVITPEEVGLSRFGDRGKWSRDWKMYDRAAREKVLKDVLSNLGAGSEPAAPGATNDPSNNTGPKAGGTSGGSQA
jgi:uncharacterized protein